VRRQRERRVRIGTLEAKSLTRESIEGRRQVRAAAVRADAIGAQRVDGDEQHVRAFERA
jgi:hypothetical protein